MESIPTVMPPSRLHVSSIRQGVQTHAVPILLGSILGANIVTMSLMNFLELQTASLLSIYLAAIIATACLLLMSGLKFPDIYPLEHGLCLLFATLFFLPRATYLMEGALGYAINPDHDDWGHIQYMASIIDSPTFPPRSTYDDSKFLSYYYAPWMLGAALRQTGMFSTVKQVLALTDWTYATFASYFVVYASKILFKERNLQKTFLTLCVFYGGFDFIYWLFGMEFNLAHAEWWAGDFGIDVEYSNFFTLLLWVPQHVLAAMAVLFGLYVLSRTDRSAARVCAGMLLASAAFSSPFVVFGALPLSLVLLLSNKRLLRSVLIVLSVFVILALPLFWIFLGRDSTGFKLGLEWFGELGPFFQQHKRAGFIVFILVTLLELWPLFWASRLAVAERLSARWLVLASSVYLLSIFFIHFFGNNYCMRGAIIPIFTLTYVATPGFYRFIQAPHRRWYQAALIPYFLGGLYEYASFSASSIDAIRNSNTKFNAEALVSNSGHEAFVDGTLLQESKQDEWGWYVLEKRRAVPKSPITILDAATLHGDNPYRLTFRLIAHRLGRRSMNESSKH